jgi:hypothetical protein
MVCAPATQARGVTSLSLSGFSTTLLLLSACETHVNVGDVDAGAVDGGAPDGGPLTDAGFDAAPLDAPLDGGPPTGPPWAVCPPTPDRWTDPVAVAATASFFSVARTGDSCLFGPHAGCLYSHAPGLAIPGLPPQVDHASVVCANGRLVISSADVDCGELTDAPWSGGAPWAEGECVPDPAASPGCAVESPVFCARVREGECCADVESCALYNPSVIRRRVCTDNCDYGFAGGRLWDRCPNEEEALLGERCTLDTRCLEATTPDAPPVRWCDGENYRVIYDYIRWEMAPQCSK